MKIIIIGAGKVGYTLAENLANEGYYVTIIDKNPDALERAEESLDVMCLRGNGVSANMLAEAGVESADLLIAVESLLRIVDGQAEIMEFVVSESNKLLNRPLKELGIPGNVIIATIVRNNEVVVPHGNDVISGNRSYNNMLKSQLFNSLSHI